MFTSTQLFPQIVFKVSSSSSALSLNLQTSLENKTQNSTMYPVVTGQASVVALSSCFQRSCPQPHAQIDCRRLHPKIADLSTGMPNKSKLDVAHIFTIVSCACWGDPVYNLDVKHEIIKVVISSHLFYFISCQMSLRSFSLGYVHSLLCTNAT